MKEEFKSSPGTGNKYGMSGKALNWVTEMVSISGNELTVSSVSLGAVRC